MCSGAAASAGSGLRAEVSGRVGAICIEARFDTTGGPLVVVGPNGAGKTSLLLMLLGLNRRCSGSIAVGTTTLLDTARGIDVPVEQRRLGYVPQDYSLFPHLNVLENVEFGVPLRSAANGGPSRREQAHALLRDFELAGLAERRPSAISGGEQQRVALARAIAAQPRALLLDEPLAALDATSRRAVRSFLAAHLRRLALPALIVTHDPADAMALGHRIAVLEAGQIVQVGTWAELRSAPATPFVAEFVA